MIQTLTNNWWLLALCGALEAIVSVLYLFMQDHDGPLTFHAWSGTFVFLGKLMLAAGACTITAGIWRSAKGKCWLLVLNGLALGALGLISSGIFGLSRLRISFRTVALLFMVIALSAGILELAAAQALRRQRHVAEKWVLALAGAASVVFASAFLALGFHWVRIDLASHFRTLADLMWWKADFLWFGSYFGFTAICMLALAVSLHRVGLDPRAKASPSL